MDLINPGMAWLALAGVVPIIIHLLNRQRYKRITWAAMEFLLAALKKTRRRLQIENLLLLLIRVLAVVFLALALSRPLLKATPLSALGQVDTHFIIVLDNSYSMNYQIGTNSLFDTAKDTAYQIITTLKPAQGDKASLILLSSNPRVVFTEISVLDTLKKELANIRVSDYGTDVFQSLSEPDHRIFPGGTFIGIPVIRFFRYNPSWFNRCVFSRIGCACYPVIYFCEFIRCICDGMPAFTRIISKTTIKDSGNAVMHGEIRGFGLHP